MTSDEEFEFETHRPRLFGLAYRLVGQVADAEDVVQETWLAWQAADRSRVANPAAYLTRAVTNRALNQLRTIQRRREAYVGPWLPEPLATAPGPEDQAVLADSLSYAMLVLLDQLNPRERAAFVLRDVFDVPAGEVAAMLGTTPAAVRALHHRARTHVRGAPDHPSTGTAPPREATERFVRAIREGDPTIALDVLAPDLELITDGGGKAQAALRPIIGLEKAVRFFLGVAARYPDYTVRVVACNGQEAVVMESAGGPSLALVEASANDPTRIGRIWVIRNPDKLAALRTSPPSVSGPTAAAVDPPADH